MLRLVQLAVSAVASCALHQILSCVFEHTFGFHQFPICAENVNAQVRQRPASLFSVMARYLTLGHRRWGDPLRRPASSTSPRCGASGEEMANDQFGSGGTVASQASSSAIQMGRTNQAKAVGQYFDTVSKAAPFPPPGAFDPAGRGTPDVAVLGDIGLGEGFQVVQDDAVSSLSGTSVGTFS